MNDWSESTLEDVCELVTDGSHYSPPNAPNGNHCMVSVRDFTQYGFDFRNCKRISEADYDKLQKQGCVAQVGDVLVGKDGARFFEDIVLYSQPEKPALLSSIAILRADSAKVIPEFLYYLLCSPQTRKDVRDNYGTGSAIPRIVLKDFKRMPLRYPSLSIQEQIVNVLRPLDDKIALNARINADLEAMADARYAEMIRDRTGVSAGVLSDIAFVTMGQSPEGSSYNENGKGEVFFQGRAEFGFRFPTRRLYTTSPKRMACENDVLMSVRAPVGDINVAYEDCCIGRGLAAIHSKNGHQSFVLYTMRALQDQLDVFNGEGTVFGSINRKALNSLPVPLPSADLMDRFEDAVAPLDAAIRINYAESIRLQILRDTLLPRLMSGAIDVSDVDV